MRLKIVLLITGLIICNNVIVLMHMYTLGTGADQVGIVHKYVHCHAEQFLLMVAFGSNIMKLQIDSFIIDQP